MLAAACGEGVVKSLVITLGAEVRLTDAGDTAEEELNGRTVEATLPPVDTSSIFVQSDDWETLDVAVPADWPSLPPEDWMGACCRREEVADSLARDAEGGPPVVIG